MSTFKAAVAQAASYPTDAMASAAKAVEMINQAAANGARLLVFPEAFIGGYPKGDSFGCPIGMRKPEGRDADLAYYKSAVNLDGPDDEPGAIGLACR